MGPAIPAHLFVLPICLCCRDKERPNSELQVAPLSDPAAAKVSMLPAGLLAWLRCWDKMLG